MVSKIPIGILTHREQVNTNRVSKSAILVLDSESLNNFDKETQQVLSSVSYVMTGPDFSFVDFVTKLEKLIETDSSQAKLARTSFIVVDDEALNSLKNSLMSESAVLVESMGEDGLDGLSEDNMTKALSKLIEARVQ